MDTYRDRRTVAFVGSRDLMSLRIALHIDQRLNDLPPDSVILVRKARVAPLGKFESVVVELAKAHGLVVRFCQPDGNDRAAVYRRDYELVEAADEIEAYFAVDRVMEGGTGHVVEAALARDRQVFAWSTDEHGHVVRVGEFEPALK